MAQDELDRHSSSDEEVDDESFKSWHARLTAYAAVQLNDTTLAKRAWKYLLADPGWQRSGDRFETKHLAGSYLR